MKKIIVPTIQGLQEEVIYNIDNFPYYRYRFVEDIGNYKNLRCMFDIETTSIRTDKGGYAFMYVWQFCVNEDVVIGRTWEEYQKFLDRLTASYRGRKIVVYVFF